ncbi:uncharacterized protein EAF02_005064 [Botrytis sinoallii]|uniref:uncharacterized protein n=1 Tax=Botrytis sinoallii TaxID=1463999 RepID=UPI0019008CA8|nr:uncharacterized protein EAF02_005064 [Botrytis sinoallii]KAF7884728.1 hypothetical protein EAF02_005064 [Botrytis sinoallii]
MNLKSTFKKSRIFSGSSADLYIQTSPNVLDIADLDCETPPAAYTDAVSFNKVCADVGKIDMCCILPILEQALICTSPSGS